MRRILSVGILSAWVGLLVVLLRSEGPRPAALPLAHESSGAKAGEQWMGVYHKGHKIGYTHQTLTRTGEGFTFSDSSLVRLTVLDAPQTVRTRMDGHLGADLSVRDVAFELSSGVGQLKAQGVVSGHQLHLTLRTGHETSEQVLPLTEPLYLPATLRASVAGQTLRPGRQLDALVFDPTALRNDRVRVTVADWEPVPETAPGVRAWRVIEEFRGLHTTAWIDTFGEVLREEGPMGLVLRRQSAEDAVRSDWSDNAALDVVASVAVPVARPIKNPRGRTSLRVRLSGIALDAVPTDGTQQRQGAELTIRQPDVHALQTYELPYRGTEHQADLVATGFMQSDHPRIRALAHQIIDSEPDALRAIVRLNDWVYRRLRKVPTISIPNALQVLDMGEGDCNEHAVLLAALGRAAGIPTRMVAGAVYLDGAFLYHAWCEVWLGQWVAVDPALHQFPADATHIKFVIGGPEEHLAMMGIVGQLGIDVLDGPTSSDESS